MPTETAHTECDIPPPAHPPRPWLTVAEVGKDLGISAKSVRRLIMGRRLKAKNISTGVRPRWRIHVQWMLDFRQSSVPQRDATME